jgi:hypothetical protein
MKQTTTLGLVLLFFSSLAHGFYDNPADNVVELTEAEFKKSVLKGDEVWIVEFYAPWYDSKMACGRGEGGGRGK